MKIRYSKNRIFFNGALGATFAIIGTIKAFEGTAGFIHYVQLILGILMVGSFFLERKFQYLNIEDGILTKYRLRKKTIHLDRIIRIQSLPGKIKLYTSDESLRINTGIIEEDSLKEFYRVLGSLELETQENPFIGWSQTQF